MDIQNEINNQPISSEVRFYKVEDLVRMTGWSENVIHKMFNDPAFPSVDFGRSKIVESHALIDYFSRKRSKATDKYWVRGEKYDKLKKKLG